LRRDRAHTSGVLAPRCGGHSTPPSMIRRPVRRPPPSVARCARPRPAARGADGC